jgi:hypothetical protein
VSDVGSDVGQPSFLLYISSQKNGHKGKNDSNFCFCYCTDPPPHLTIQNMCRLGLTIPIKILISVFLIYKTGILVLIPVFQKQMFFSINFDDS